MYDDFDDLLLDDGSWWARLGEGLRLLADYDQDQTTIWPVDDFIGTKRFLPCPQRGTHHRLAECWMCFCDFAWGYANAQDVLDPGSGVD